MCCQTDPDELARRRLHAAFERCEKDICCRASTRHRPHCARRAERLAQDSGLLALGLTRPGRWVPEMETRSEIIGGRRGCVWMLAAIVSITALAMVFSWWVVYG